MLWEGMIWPNERNEMTVYEWDDKDVLQAAYSGTQRAFVRSFVRLFVRSSVCTEVRPSVLLFFFVYVCSFAWSHDCASYFFECSIFELSKRWNPRYVPQNAGMQLFCKVAVESNIARRRSC